MAYTIDEIYMIIAKYPTYIEWIEKDRDRVPLYNALLLLLILDSLVATHMNVLRCWKWETRKGRKKLFFVMKNGKYSSWIVIICCHTHIHNNSMRIGDKGHEMRIQISMPIYNSIVWLIHSLGLNKFLSLICTEWWRWARGGDGGFIMKYWKFSM